MVKCKECGKEFSVSVLKKLFGSPNICPTCKANKKEKIQQFLLKLKEFGSDNYLSKEEEQELDAFKKGLGLKQDDLTEANRLLSNLREKTKLADIATYESRLKKYGADGYLDPQEEKELKKLKDELSLTDTDVKPTLGELAHLKILTAIKNGNLPVLQSNIMLNKNEVLHYEIYADLMEERSRTTYVGGSQGVSFRIMKGVSYRVGAFKGERIVNTFNVKTDSGTLHITSKRVLFLGSKKTVTYQIPKIVNILRYADAIQFQKENEAKPKYFLIGSAYAIDEIGMIISQIVNRD